MAGVVEQILTKEMNLTVRQIRKRSLAAGQKATGNTLRSLEVKTKGADQDVNGQILGAPHFGVLKGGRKPGKVPANFKAILRKWAAAKGLKFTSSTQFNTWAHFTIKKIKKHGTKLYASGRKLDIYDTPIKDLEARLDKALRGFYSAQITDEVNKF